MLKLAKYVKLYYIWKSDSFELRVSPHSTFDLEGWKQELTLAKVQSFYEAITEILVREVQERSFEDSSPFMRIEIDEFDSTLFLGSLAGSECSNQSFLFQDQIYQVHRNIEDVGTLSPNHPKSFDSNDLSTTPPLCNKRLGRTFCTLCWRALVQVLRDGLFELDDFEVASIPTLRLKYHGRKGE